MGAWKKQTEQTTKYKKQWSESQQFSFIHSLQNATNEEEVKAAYIREFSLPVKTQERHDLLVNRVLFEFKYSVKLCDLQVAAKVIAQAIYYINRLSKKGRLDEVKYLVIADKDEARIFKIAEFQLFYDSCEYQWECFRPSSPDPKLTEAVKNSKILESNRVYRLTCQDEIDLFSSNIYKLLSPLEVTDSYTKYLPDTSKSVKSKFSLIGVVLTILFSSAIFVECYYYYNPTNQSFPATKK